MTDLDLDKLEALAKSATPGPWKTGSGDHWSREVRGSDNQGIAWCGHSSGHADAMFIAAARAAIPALIERARQAESRDLRQCDEIQRLFAMIDRMDEDLIRLRAKAEAREKAARIEGLKEGFGIGIRRIDGRENCVIEARRKEYENRIRELEGEQ